MIPTINKPTRITRDTARVIDHIISNTVITDIQHSSGTMKADISDYFPIVFFSFFFFIWVFFHIHSRFTGGGQQRKGEAILTYVKKVSQKIRHNLLIKASKEKNK